LQKLPHQNADQCGLACVRRTGDADRARDPVASSLGRVARRRIPLRQIIKRKAHALPTLAIDTLNVRRIQYPVFHDASAIVHFVLP
jgi:hypothetical protein